MMRAFQEFQTLAEKCDTIDELFGLWKEAQINDPYYPQDSHPQVPIYSFHADGIVDFDESNYWNANPRVLFLLKEPNVMVSDYTPTENSSAVDWVRERYCQSDSKHKMCTVIAKIYAEVFQGKKMDVPESLKQIAYMNLNKRGGDSRAKRYLLNYVQHYQAYIRREIELLSPEYVVVGGEGLLSSLKKFVCPGLENAPIGISSGHFLVDPEHNIRYFDTYHFSRPNYQLTMERFLELRRLG